MIDKINKQFYTTKSTIYDTNSLTILESIGKFLEKINEVVEVCNDTKITTEEKLNYLLNDGLVFEVNKKIIELCENKTITNLINSQIFLDLNNKFNNAIKNVTNGTQNATNTEIVTSRKDFNVLNDRLDFSDLKLNTLENFLYNKEKIVKIEKQDKGTCNKDGLININQSSTNTLNFYNVEGLNYIKIKCDIMAWSSLIFADNLNNCLFYFSNSSDNTRKIDEFMKVPDGTKYIVSQNIKPSIFSCTNILNNFSMLIKKIPFTTLNKKGINHLGSETETENFNATDFIEVFENAKIMIKNLCSFDKTLLCFYNKDKILINRIDYNGNSGVIFDSQEYEIPKNCKYIRFTFKDNAELYYTPNSENYLNTLEKSKEDITSYFTSQLNGKCDKVGIYENQILIYEEGLMRKDLTLYTTGIGGYYHSSFNVALGDKLKISCNSFSDDNIPPILFLKDDKLIDFYICEHNLTLTDLEIEITNSEINKIVINGRNTSTLLVKKFIPKDLEKFINEKLGKETDKNGIIFGDSIMQFHNPEKILKAKTGINFINCGMGGTKLSYNNKDKRDVVSFSKLCEAIYNNSWSTIDNGLIEVNNSAYNKAVAKLKNTNFNNIDYIIISYGTNDFHSNMKLKNTENLYDITSVDGALRQGIKYLLEKYKHLKFYVFTPCFRSRYDTDGDGKDSDNFPNGINKFLIEYAEQIKNTCDNLHIPCKNMYNTSQVNIYNSAYYLSDGLHRTEEGYKLLDEQYSNFIMSN